jgi:hypothetical protein
MTGPPALRREAIFRGERIPRRARLQPKARQSLWRPPAAGALHVRDVSIWRRLSPRLSWPRDLAARPVHRPSAKGSPCRRVPARPWASLALVVAGAARALASNKTRQGIGLESLRGPANERPLRGKSSASHPPRPVSRRSPLVRGRSSRGGNRGRVPASEIPGFTLDMAACRRTGQTPVPGELGAGNRSPASGRRRASGFFIVTTIN